MMRAVAHPIQAIAALALLGVGCGKSEAVERVVELWHYDFPTAAAPPGIGPEHRTLGGVKEATGSTGRFVTLDQLTGLPVEGPYMDIPLTDHAPVMVGSTIILITKIGTIVGLDLAGQTRFMKPPIGGPGQTGPLLAVGAEVRFGTADGLVVALDGATGDERWHAAVSDPVLTRVAAGPDGRTYATTDLGRVVGFDGSGQLVFDQTVPAPAGAPAVTSAGDIAVGSADGVVLFTANGTQKWKHPRAARVVATRALGNDVLAWGEDGIFERLSDGGAVKLSFRSRPMTDPNPPPFYAEPVTLGSDAFGLLDASGMAHLVDAAGQERASLSASMDILPEVAVSDFTSLIVADKSSLRAIQFTLMPAE